MSIYRRIDDDRLSDVYATTPVAAQKITAAATPAAADEQLERTKRRKGEPANKPLPRTVQWMARLPRDVQPVALLHAFARIANDFALDWDDTHATFAHFDQLLVDRRGNRKGFPAEVMEDIVRLHSYYASLHRIPADTWNHQKRAMSRGQEHNRELTPAQLARFS